jgi:hypothetical protein
MKVITLLTLPLAVSAGLLEARQRKSGSAPVAGVEKLQAQIRVGSQRTLTKFGREYSNIY